MNRVPQSTLRMSLFFRRLLPSPGNPSPKGEDFAHDTSSDGGAVDPAAGVCGGGGHGAAAMEERIIGDVPDGVQTLAAGTRWVDTSTSTHRQPHDAHSDRIVATVQGGD
eukprot:1195670-Prorocentrum_minimum.AAC.2